MENYFLIFSIVLLSYKYTEAVPVIPEESIDSVERLSIQDVIEEEHAQLPNYTVKDLYVIRKVVYEIGILTNPDNSTDYDNSTHEQIDLSFYDPNENGTFIDLSNIPIPIETNISGIALTAIIPTNLGSFPIANGTGYPLFPSKQVKVTKNISSTDVEKNARLLSGKTENIIKYVDLLKLNFFQASAKCWVYPDWQLQRKIEK
ncbi:hypothetical protein ABEB36_001329 [Hypothenemus hampei]|uniref:Uncharacterized protein n=1 Tax=Hypothenemus hampei TaxID=57062 RepID=A0ABD1FE93_HYPHA